MAVVLMHPVLQGELDNSFTGLLAEGLGRRGHDVKPFSWPLAVAGRYDVLHVHWPELITSHRTPAGRAAKGVLLVLVAALARLRGRRVVATVHNLAPHERVGWWRRRVIALWYRLCTSRAYLMGWAAEAAPVGAGVHIPHHTYGITPAAGLATTRSGTGLMFGFLRRYKGIEAAIAGVSQTPDVPLRIVGKPVPDDYGDDLRASTTEMDHVSIEPRSVPFAELVDLVASAQFVLLPYPNMYSSGAAVLALEARTPIIVVRSSSTEELSDEFGELWVYLMEPDWSGPTLHAAVKHVRRLSDRRRTSTPPLASRSVEKVAERYEKLYTGVV